MTTQTQLSDKILDSAEALMTRIKRGQNVGAARQYNEEYAFARIWRLVVRLANCQADQKDMLIEYKCEIRALLLLMQEMNVDLEDAEAASRKFRAIHQRPAV